MATADIGIDPTELLDIDLPSRLDVARKVGALVRREKDPKEREAALTLAGMLAADTSISVREALGRELKTCQALPTDLLVKITADIDQISVPFLLASKALDDGLLLDLISEGSLGVQEAIADRDAISEQVTFALCDEAGREAVHIVIENNGATLSKKAISRMTDRFPEDRSLLEKLVTRSDMVPELAEKVIFKVSEKFSQYLSDRFGLASDYATYLLDQSKKKLFHRTLDMARPDEVMNYLKQLHDRGGLTSDLLLSFAQENLVRLFIATIAVQLKQSYPVVEKRLNAGNVAVLNKMLARIGYEKSVSGAIGIAYKRLFNL